MNNFITYTCIRLYETSSFNIASSGAFCDLGDAARRILRKPTGCSLKGLSETFFGVNTRFSQVKTKSLARSDWSRSKLADLQVHIFCDMLNSHCDVVFNMKSFLFCRLNMQHMTLCVLFPFINGFYLIPTAGSPVCTRKPWQTKFFKMSSMKAKAQMHRQRLMASPTQTTKFMRRPPSSVNSQPPILKA